MTEKECIDYLCCRASPLFFAVIACVVIMTVSIALDTYASWKYNGQTETVRMFIDCLNGVSIQIGDRIVTCNISKPLVKGI